MTNTSPKIVFFGSGPVATASLEKLLEHTEVEHVITKPNPAHHRGTAPVIELCKQHGIPYSTPDGKASLTELFTTADFSSRVGVVIDYGIIIDQVVIDYFEFGIINSHFSLLPEWRGADPITFSILSGQPETGVSLMSIVQAMDEGPLLAQGRLVIQPAETSQSLTHKLIHVSDELLIKYLPLLLAGSLQLTPQTGQATYSRKLSKADGIIDWTKPAAVLEREIRGYHEWPKSNATVGEHQLIIREADVIETTGTPSDYVADKKSLLVYCGQNALNITRVQPHNKKEMPTQAFLSGYSL